jgi:hypothetical protein
MAAQASKTSTWTLRLIVYAGAVTGIALVVASFAGDDTPGWWLAVGIPLALVFGTLASTWIWFRVRYSPEERQARYEAMDSRRAEVAKPVERSKLAFQATKHKTQVLRSGADAAATITFIADGGRANEFRKLVYLELLVTRDGGEPYEVRTGEFVTGASAGSVTPGRELWVKVDLADPQRVAVDWERSLRLS